MVAYHSLLFLHACGTIAACMCVAHKRDPKLFTQLAMAVMSGYVTVLKLCSNSTATLCHLVTCTVSVFGRVVAPMNPVHSSNGPCADIADSNILNEVHHTLYFPTDVAACRCYTLSGGLAFRVLQEVADVGSCLTHCTGRNACLGSSQFSAPYLSCSSASEWRTVSMRLRRHKFSENTEKGTQRRAIQADLSPRTGVNTHNRWRAGLHAHPRRSGEPGKGCVSRV